MSCSRDRLVVSVSYITVSTAYCRVPFDNNKWVNLDFIFDFLGVNVNCGSFFAVKLTMLPYYKRRLVGHCNVECHCTSAILHNETRRWALLEVNQLHKKMNLIPRAVIIIIIIRIIIITNIYCCTIIMMREELSNVAWLLSYNLRTRRVGLRSYCTSLVS